MHAFFAAVASDRFNVAFPLIGVQDFARAVRESSFQARVDTIRPPFEHASGKALLRLYSGSIKALR